MLRQIRVLGANLPLGVSIIIDGGLYGYLKHSSPRVISRTSTTSALESVDHSLWGKPHDTVVSTTFERSVSGTFKDVVPLQNV